MTTNASYDHINDSHALTNDRNEPHHDFHQFSHFNQDMNTNLRPAEPANDDDDLYLGKFLIYYYIFLLTDIGLIEPGFDQSPSEDERLAENALRDPAAAVAVADGMLPLC